MNSIGLAHGGVYASLLDAALGHAISFSPMPGYTRYATTLSLNTTFLKSTREGTLTASGRLEGKSGRVVVASGEVRDKSGALLAVAQGSFLYFPGSESPEGVPKRSRP